MVEREVDGIQAMEERETAKKQAIIELEDNKQAIKEVGKVLNQRHAENK